MTVVMEEGVVLRRALWFLAPSKEKSTVVSMTPSVSIYTNSLAPTSWKDSQLQGEEKIRRERVQRDKYHFQLIYLAR
jgi:hypothetical protein